MMRATLILSLIGSLCLGLFSSISSARFYAPEMRAQDPPAKSAATKSQKIRNPLNDLLDEVQADFDKNDYTAAIVPLQKFIAEKPDLAYAHFQLAYAYTELKRSEEARAEYEKAIALDPKMAEAQLNLGILLLDKDPAAAVVPLRRAVDLLPSQTRPRYLLGLAQERSGDLTGAELSFEGAVHLDPKDAESLIKLADLQLRNGHTARAEASYRRSLELAPQSAPALRGLALSLALQKKPEAADAYRKYLAVQPQDQAARSLLIHYLFEQQQYDAALAELDKTAATQPPDVDDLKLRADVLIAQKKYNEAVAALRQAISLAPADTQLHGGLGRIDLELRNYADAEKELKAALQLDRNNLSYWKDLSTTYYLAGNYPATLAALDVLAKAQTPAAGEWFIRALCYDKLGQAQPALDAYRRFIEIDQDRNPDQVWQAKQRIHVLEKSAEKKR